MIISPLAWKHLSFTNEGNIFAYVLKIFFLPILNMHAAHKIWRILHNCYITERKVFHPTEGWFWPWIRILEHRQTLRPHRTYSLRWETLVHTIVRAIFQLTAHFKHTTEKGKIHCPINHSLSGGNPTTSVALLSCRNANITPLLPYFVQFKWSTH